MAETYRAVKHDSASSRGEEESNYSKLRTRMIGALAAVGVSSAALFGAAPANADEIVIIPGAGDPTGAGYENQLHATGQIGPNDRVHRVNYPADIMSTQRSVNEGVANGHAVLDQAIAAASPGERVQIRGYSLGGIPAAELARQRFGDVVAPGTVIIDGSPVSSTGLFANQDELVRFGLNMANGFGVPTHYRAPAGSEVRGSEQDIWAYGGHGGVGELIPKAMDTFMGPAHAVQNPHAPGARVWVGPDGITQVQYPGTGTGGIPPNAVTMGGPGAVAPAPAPAPEARPRPNSPNFRAVSHDWIRKHPEQYPEKAAKLAAQDAKKEAARSSDKSESRGNARKVVRESKKFEPPVKAPQATRLNR